MNLFVFIATGAVILAAPLYAAEITDEMRQARADAIREARYQCALMLKDTPREDRLHVMMNECYKDNLHVFQPIEPSPPPKPFNTGTPVFHPDPNDPRTR